MRKLLLSTILLLALTGTLSAQQADVASLRESTANAQSGIGISPAGNAFSLLDLSRIKWSHSYSVSFFSGGNTSGSIGLLSTTMNYDISSKLHLAVNLGVLHSPGAMFGRGESKANILPGFRLDYRPSESVLMSISFQKYVGYRPLYGRRYY